MKVEKNGYMCLYEDVNIHLSLLEFVSILFKLLVYFEFK